MKKICVLGLGYIGLPTALLFAQNYKVIGLDVNKKILALLKKGKIPFEEPGLQELFNKVKGNFTISDSVEDADVFLIAVPTPFEEEKKIADLQYVKSATEMISPYLKDDNLVILESTVPPGTSRQLVLPILVKSGVKNFYYSYCPERAKPGSTINEMINNARIIGGVDDKSSQLTKDIYSSFVKGGIYLTNTVTAEFVKLMENTFRDVNIALANEFLHIVRKSKINIWEAIEFANKHPRVNIHKPGPGVGGHCLAIDPWFLTQNTKKFKLIRLAREMNDSQPNDVFYLVKDFLKDIKKPTVTVLGVAYKGDVDDTRLTPALRFIDLMLDEGFNVKIHDPFVKEFKYRLLSLEEAIKDSDCIVIITDHTLFKQINPEKIAIMMRSKNVFDTRNILDHKKWQKAGFNVEIL